MAERSRMMKQFDMCLLEYRDAEMRVGEAVMLRKLLAPRYEATLLALSG